jgi:multidrug resistance efflux pump
VVAVQQPNTVSAEAFVVPLQQANLSFEVGGRVNKIHVQEGQVVQAGQLLLELDQTSQQAGLANAQAGLASAQAQLAEVKAGATPAQIAQAEAVVAQAQAALDQAIAGPTPAEIAEAEAQVGSAQAQLSQVLAGTRQEEVEAAAAQLQQTEADVRLAQADYDKYVYGDPEEAEPYGVALQKATLAYQAAKAQYEAQANGATKEAVAVARAGVAEAQAGLAKVRAGSTAEQIAQAQAEVANAEGALAELRAGSTAEQIAVAEAGVQTAAAEVKAAEAELAKTRLVAPFAGMVSAIPVDVGETVAEGKTVIALGDNSRWQVETDDLTEIDVVRVRAGQAVTISVDALPGVTYQGKVVRITPRSETKAGDVTYTVLIDFTKGDPQPLRWGMTTFVDIQVD